ncbi:MAG: amidohydrolase [Bacteroidota bacterium]
MIKNLFKHFCVNGSVLFALLSAQLCSAQANPLLAKADQLALEFEPKVIAWRRAIHQHPELSNREFKTAALVAAYLRSLGMEVKTGIAHTGVTGILKCGKTGPVIALRADMDALPITERNDLSFRSTDSTMYNGKMTGVMHACGHDSHVAMLLGAAGILTSMKKDLSGTIKFIFQPSEEGPPGGEEGGAKMMVKEGVLNDPPVDVIFGQHISSGDKLGTFTYRPGSVSAENDIFRITIHGKQTHGAAPWAGVDPIVTASQIVMALQTIISRNSALTTNAAVITVGSFHAGNRENIIPEDAVLTGTIRTLDTGMRDVIQKRMHEVVSNIAASAGATAETNISMEDAMLVNDPALTHEMAPTLNLLAINNGVTIVPAGMGAEDFAYYAQRVPGFFFSTGALPPGKKPSEVMHHTPDLLLDESSFKTGVRALCYLTINYMDKHAVKK